MKTIKFFTLGFLVAMALVGQAQTFTQPGWYTPINIRPSFAGNTGTAGSQVATPLLTGSQTFSPMGLSGSANIAEATTPEIQALARGLENDPTRIFDYVHDHIRHVLYYGSKKGAQLTLLERSGNDFDQCALLVALLQAAGYTNVGYQFGMLKMPYDATDGTHNDLHHWLELNLVNTNAVYTSNYFNVLLGNRGYPWLPPNYNNAFYPVDANTFEFQRIWVTLTNGATVYCLDPAFKISEPVAGINLASAMGTGFSSNSLMTAAGGTSTPDYVKSLTEATLRSTLQGYNSNLLATIQSNYPNASVLQILGGQQIVPWTNALSQSLMFPVDTQGGSFPVLGWTSEPTNFMSTLAISYGGVSQAWYFPQLQGQRLSLTFSNNGTGQLWLQDSLILQTNITGGSVSVTLTANHPYGWWDAVNNVPTDNGLSDASVPRNYQATNASYAIIYAFEPDPAWLFERERQLDTYRQQGYTNTSRQVVTETLNVMGLNWLLQTKLNQDILAQQIGVLPENVELLGRMGQESGHGYYVDAYLQASEPISDGGNPSTDFQFINPKTIQFFDLIAYFGSAMEHGIIEQLQSSNLVAASTVKMLEVANANNQTIYLATSTNWTSGANVLGHLVHYDTTSLGNLISQGYSLLLATNGAINLAGVGSWIGCGYVQQQMTAMGMEISGPNYNGGYSEFPTLIPDPVFISTLSYDNPVYVDPAPVSVQVSYSADPVNMADASFDLDTTDISLGQAEPMGMTLSRNYTPARQHVNLANMGNGWVHSYYFNLAAVSAPLASLGETTPAQTAPMLAATCAAVNLYSPQLNPKNWMVTALIAKWGIDQTISNAVSITLGKDTLEFIKQPDGSFTPPANCIFSLTNSGTYILKQRNANTFLFNSSRQLTSITNQSGDKLTLGYTGTNLTTATDWKNNRTLTFTYSGTPLRITKVADNFGRSVNYGYSTNADNNIDLVSVTDPEGKASTFAYDTNHQITATYDALNRLVVTNIYDSLGHVMTQYTQGDTNKAWQIYWSGWETVSQDPAGNKQRYFYDDDSRLIGQRDALGDTSQTVYDGQDHAVMTISPLNEINQSIYDGNNNVIQTIDPLGYTNQFVYDAKNNLIHIIDPRGSTTSFGYDSAFRVIGTTNGAGDWVNYAYNSDGTIHTRTDLGGITTYGYDAYGQLNGIIYPGNLGTNGFLNNAFGDVLSQTNGRGFVTSFQYNNRRQLTNSIAPTNMTTRVAYDAIGNTVSTTDARGFSTTNTWDVLRHLLATTLPATSQGTAIVTNIYDNRDWLTETIDPLSKTTFYTNDAAQHLIATSDPLLRTTLLTYDADGHNITSTNAAGNGTTQQYDARGSLTVLTDPANRVVQRAYDGAGNQITLTNRNGKIWQFQFDSANRLTNTISPLSRSSSEAYNNRGLLVSSKDPASQTQTFNYDAKGRLTNRTDSVGATLYKYDADDNRTNVTENGLTNSWTYDAYDRVAGYSDVYGNLIQYKYDLNGNVTNLIYPGNKNVYYYYDSNNHMTNMTDWSGRKTGLAYDLAGRLTGITRPNGTQRIIGYDAAGQTTNILEKLTNGTIIALFKLGWDNASRMQFEYSAPLPHAATMPTRNMTFDDDNRLTGVDGNTIVNDTDGNMTSGPLTNDTLFTYTYDARNRLTAAGGLSYAYDPPGNRTAITNGASVTKFVINPNSVLSQALMRITGGVTNYYVYGPGVVGLLYQVTETATATNTLTYHYDCRGSTVALTDGSGTNVTDRVEYSTYATTTYRSGTNDTPFLFNGQFGVMTDPNGLLCMRLRYYNPFICRFINPDPSGFVGGLNFYAYADGNPVSYLDPFGLWSWSSVAWNLAKGVAVGAVITAAVIVAAPVVATIGAAAIIGSAATVGIEVSGTMACTIAVGAVDGALITSGAIGAVGVSVDTYQQAQQGNWDAVAYNVGNLAGGYGVGVSGGGRFLSDSLGVLRGNGVSASPELSSFDLLGALQNERRNRLQQPFGENSDLPAWASSAPTPFSGGLTATTTAAGAVNGPTQQAIGQTIGLTADWFGNTIQNFGTSSH